MKKTLVLILTLVLTLAMIVGCAAPAADAATTESPASEAAPGAMTGDMTVVSREDGSGTRGAFVELVGVVDGDDNDMTTLDADIQNSTGGVMTTVASTPAAIGYISLGSLDDTVSAVSVDGVEPTVDNIKAGTYAIARPFNIAYQESSLTDLAKDFISFIMSEEGQAIAEAEGTISNGAEGTYEGSGMSGTISVGGSTSVTPVMEKLSEAYQVHNPDVKIEIQSTGSSAGMTAAIDGTVEIGMASREVKQEELDAGLTPKVIALDGIAVVVNNENSLSDISMDQLKNIYLGEITTWDELA